MIRKKLQSGPSNRGGACVTQHSYVAEAADRHLLYVDGPVGAIKQVMLVDPEYVRQTSASAVHHALEGVGPNPRSETIALLDLLGSALTVPCGDGLDFAIALDWYKKVVDGVDPREWDNTALADLVHRGKYWYKKSKDVAKLREVGLAVVGEIVEFIAAHPLLCDVDAIAAVPGHDSHVLSFGSRVADAVARERDAALVRCTCVREFRSPAKALELDRRADAVRGLFRCARDMSGRSVLVVDDVYGSGATAQETARALRAAGAVCVAGLAAVRTMKSL
ncbi:hypothetical protein LRC484719_16080 [Mycobacterium riyadhense]